MHFLFVLDVCFYAFTTTSQPTSLAQALPGI